MLEFLRLGITGLERLHAAMTHPEGTVFHMAEGNGARRQGRSRLKVVAAVLGALVIVGGVAAVLSSRLSGSSGQAEKTYGLVLTLSATTVTPGEIITRTVEGANVKGVITSTVMTLEARQTDGSWKPIYYLSLSTTDPQTEPFSPNLAITLAGLTPTALEVRIPPVRAGHYRISQVISLMSATQDTLQTTLHTMIVVTDANTK